MSIKFKTQKITFFKKHDLKPKTFVLKKIEVCFRSCHKLLVKFGT